MRNKFEQRSILLRGEQQRNVILSLIPNLPLDTDKPLEIVVREQVKPRKLDQNALMWVGPLKDIATQAWVHGRQFTAEVWHEHFKREFLPDQFDPELCKEGYTKWDFTPSGERVLIGSTTELTVKGMAQYITQIEAFGANLGVMYHANPRQYGGF